MAYLAFIGLARNSNIPQKGQFHKVATFDQKRGLVFSEVSFINEDRFLRPLFLSANKT